MRLLFYVEPFLDKSFIFCNFFENYFKGLVIPWLTNLEKFINENKIECEITLICSEVCENFINKNQILKSKIIFLKNQTLCDLFGNYENYVSLKKNNPTSEKLEKLIKLISKELNHQEPNIIIGCSNNLGFIENFFKESTILYNESGLFGYIDEFDHTLYFDIIQNNQSYLNSINIDEFRITLDENEAKNYDLFFKKLKTFFTYKSEEIDIFKTIDIKKYKKIGLFALQRWDSELMQMNTDFECELDYIINVLDNISPKFALLITLHKTSSIVANPSIQKLLYDKYSNIKIIDTKISTPSISLLNYCDFVITNSSTTGFYAILLDKILLIASANSWFKNLADCNNIENFNYTLENNICKNKNKWKQFLVCNFFIPSKLFFNGEFFYKFLKNIHDAKSNEYKVNPYKNIELNNILIEEKFTKENTKNYKSKDIYKKTKKIKFNLKDFFRLLKK